MTNTFAPTCLADYAAMVAAAEDKRDLDEAQGKLDLYLDNLPAEGEGTEEESKCPHCGIDHLTNGYSTHDPEDGCAHEEREHCCLACGGEWGARVDTQDPKAIAAGWSGTYKDYLEKMTAAPFGLTRSKARRTWRSIHGAYVTER